VSDRKIDAYPLTWPDGWKRESVRQRARFGDHSMTRAVRECFAELLRLGVPDWSVVISSNVQLRLDGTPRANAPRPTDPGVAVWFTIGKERKVLACDRWDRPEHNLWAVAQHIGALRAQERWGVGSLEQAFRGYAALPAPSDNWRDVLELRSDAGEAVCPFKPAEIAEAFRDLAMMHHPDRGGSPEAFQRLVKARDEALRELAGEGSTP
jgi:hypothetical protein